jgi:putative hydroxymethylpyrimidine transporter CytX
MADLAQATRRVGIDPIPLSERRLGFFDTFVLWADLGISFLVMVVGMFLVPGLGLGQALVAILVGALIGNVLLGLIATIGSDTAMPTMVLLRPVLGLRGSYVPSVLNVLQLIGWATFEIIIMGQAAHLLSQRFLGSSSYLAWVVFFGAITTLMAVGGPVLVVKQWLEKFAVWAVLLSTLWLTYAVATSYDVGKLCTRPGTGTMSFWLAVDLVAVMPISWVPLVADYSRYTRQRSAAFWATGLGYLVPHVWFYALGAVLALAAGVASDPNAPIAPLLAAIAGLTAGWAAVVIVLVDESDEAFANIYSAAVSAQNILPSVSQRTLTCIIGLLALVLAATIPLVQYESFLLLIGSIFVPLLGILVADYFVLHGRRYDLAELYRVGGYYWYHGGVNWLAVAVWFAGFLLYLCIAGVPPLGLAGWAPWLGATLPSFLFGLVGYLLVSRVAFRRADGAAIQHTPNRAR